MGDPMTYLTVEIADSELDAVVHDAIDEWKASWASIVTRDDTIASQYHGIDVEKATRVVERLGDAVDRALVVSVIDSSRVGTGRLFVRVDDRLLLVETVTGGENRGVDVVDYIRRHYGFPGVGYDA
ncbi:hypothetical protein [Halomontanus rarus]|uniref:hypothetical protein n=1 Tax=Halomontanus rarus TaxID=3034020 RepID=UPI0023E84F14|nr:hypothetical protein [Halovivax sp. TS33]